MRIPHAARSTAAVFIGSFLIHFNSSAQDRIIQRCRRPSHRDAHRQPPCAGARRVRHRRSCTRFPHGSHDPGASGRRRTVSFARCASRRAARPRFAAISTWLDPAAFENRFGVSESDVARVTEWLTSQGFSIDEIPAGRRTIVFSGTAAQVEAAFHTPIHIYRVGGRAASRQCDRSADSGSAGGRGRRRGFAARFSAARRCTCECRPRPSTRAAARTIWRPPISRPFTTSRRCIRAASPAPARPSPSWAAPISMFPTCSVSQPVRAAGEQS